MASDNKRLNYILGLVDNITAPTAKAQKSVQQMGKQASETQKKYSELQGRLNDVRAYKAAQEAATKLGEKTGKLSKVNTDLQKELSRTREANRLNNAEIRKAEAVVTRLTKAGGDNAHVIARQQQKVDQLRATQVKGREAVDRITQAIKSNSQEAAAHEKIVQAQSKSMGALGKSLTTAGINVGRLDRAESNLVRAQKSVNSELGKQQELLRKTTDRQNKLTAAKEKAAKAEQAANKAMMAGAKVMAGGAAMAGGVYAAGSPHRNFDAQMSAVQATGAMDGDAKARLAKLARDEAKVSAWGATEAGQAQEYLVMAGFDEQAINNSLRGVLNLASATKTGLGETADIASNILSGFGLDPAEMNRVGDVLTKVTTSANTNLMELGGAMKYVAPVAKAAGYSLESMAAAAGLMANAGIKDSQSGTALRAAVLRMAALPKKAKEAFDELNIQTSDAAGNMRPLENVLVDVAKAMDGMGSADKLKNLSAMFGTEASAGLAELLDKSTGAELEAFINKLENSKGAAAQAAATRLKNLDGDLKVMWSGVEELQLKFGATFDKMYRGVIRFATKSIAAVDEWMTENPKMVKALGLVATALGVLMSVSGALIVGLGALWLVVAKGRLAMFLLRWAVMDVLKVFGAMLLRIGALTLGLLKNVAVIGLQVGWWVISRTVMLGWAVACGVARGAMAAFNLVMMANPIFLMIAAIAALVAAGVWLWKNWGNLPEAFSQLWADICGLFDQGVAWIKEALGFDPMAIIGDMWGGLTDFFDSMFDGIWNKFTGMIGGIVERVKGLGSRVLGGFGMFDDETAEAVKDAPKVSPDTGKAETPKNVTKGNQLAPVRQTVNSNVTVSPAITIHAKEGVDAKELAAEVTKQIADLQRKAERQNRGQLVDGY